MEQRLGDLLTMWPPHFLKQMKNLEDMDWNEMTDYCTWLVIEGVAKGTPLRTLVWRIIDRTLMWQKLQKEKRDAK